MRELGRREEALAWFDRAIELLPGRAVAYRKKGIVLAELGRLKEAQASYQTAFELLPGNPQPRFEFGILLRDLGHFDLAMEQLDQALAIDPRSAKARYYKGDLLLLQGRYAEGWELAESRFEADPRPPEPALDGRERWDGSQPLEKKSILIRPEVGLGDYLMYARYVPLLQARGGRVVALCPAPLVSLVESSFPDVEVVAEGSPVAATDYQCFLMSLPRAFGTTAGTLPRTVPYIRVAEPVRAEWSRRLGPPRRPRVGLAWSGRSSRHIDGNPHRARPLPFEELEPLLRAPCDFHVLQTEVTQRDAKQLDAHSNVTLHVESIRDFADTAAIAEQMDAIVSIDTSVAHLAGALGKRLWLALPPACDNRWLATGDASPWYPSATLVRRRHGQGWGEVVELVRTALDSLFAPQAGGRHA